MTYSKFSFLKSARHFPILIKNFSSNNTTPNEEPYRTAKYIAVGLATTAVAVTVAKDNLLSRQFAGCIVIGNNAPEKHTRPLDQARLVWKEEEVSFAGQGNGKHGRSEPNKGVIVFPDGTHLYGYEKEAFNGREGFLKEVIYHSLAQLVMPGKHPRIKILETRIGDSNSLMRFFPGNDKKSSYRLFVESIGENEDLQQYAKKMNDNPKDLSKQSSVNLGCAVAFPSMIGSVDAFLRNFVIVFEKDKIIHVYPIDFEKTSTNMMKFMDLSINPHTGARQLIRKGGLMEFCDKDSLGPVEITLNNVENSDGIGEAYKVVGGNHQQVLDYFVQHIASDAEEVIKMYHNVASLTLSELDTLLSTYDFILTAAETDTYREQLITIISATREHLLNNGFTLPLSAFEEAAIVTRPVQ